MTSAQNTPSGIDWTTSPARDVASAFLDAVRPGEQCSMFVFISALGGDTDGMCSGPVMYTAVHLDDVDERLGYRLCVACAAEFRKAGNHRIRSLPAEARTDV